MKNRTCLRAALGVAAVLTMGLSQAIAQEGALDLQYSAQKNSEFCGYTFFTNGDDALDFRADSSRRCFDMKGGDDLMILNRTDFPAGIELSTGTGRDTVWATDGPDKIIDPDGEDKDIRTFGGDDTIDIRTKVDQDPFRGVEQSERTTIRPGSGANRILLGQDVSSNAFARRGFNILLVSEPGATDEVGGVCGRPNDTRGYDVRTTDLPETTNLKVNTFGCGIGLFGIHGDVETRQVGGRLSLQTSSSGYRVSHGQNIPRLTGEIRAGSSLMLDIDQSDPETDLSWKGQGEVTFRNRMSKAEQGGFFDIKTRGGIYYQGEVTLSPVVLGLAAEGILDLNLEGRSQTTSQLFHLAAARMDITWTYRGGSAFPEIRNSAPMTWEAMIYEQPWIDFENAPKPMAGGGAIEDPDTPVNQGLPLDVPDLEPEIRQVEVLPGNTRLTLVLRRQNDPYGNCASLRVVDVDGELPDLVRRCADPAGPVEMLRIDDAGAYERILVAGREMSLDLSINADSGFKVDRLDIRF